MLDRNTLEEFSLFAGKLADTSRTTLRDLAQMPFSPEIKGHSCPVADKISHHRQTNERRVQDANL